MRPPDRASCVRPGIIARHVMDPDLVLLERWSRGDREAGQALFTRHFREIYRFFEHKVGASADDLAQRTFLACTSARERFRGVSTFRTFLFGIARNELFLYLRQQASREHVDFDATSIAELVTSPGRRPDRSRQVEELRAALAELPAEQQLLLELHYWHDLDAAALGEMLGAASGTIRVRLLRARRALRDQLLARGGAGALAGVIGDRLGRSLSEPDLEHGAV
jgi:RNA polymerase sigma factor (sigma-70 family)